MAKELINGVAINGGGFTSMQRTTSSVLTQPSDLSEAINVDLNSRIGVVQSVSGYTAHGLTGSSTILGLHGFVNSTGTGIPVRVLGTKIQYHNGTIWTDSGTTTLTASSKARLASFLGREFIVNGAETLSSSDGVTWNATQLTSAPTLCSYIDVFSSRLFLISKDTIYWSSIPDASLNITWNTTSYNVKPNPYDNSGSISGSKALRSKLIIFKQFAVYRFIQFDNTNVNIMPIDENLGCPDERASIASGDTCYFFGTSKDGDQGIYMTNGDQVQLISRPIQDIIDAVPQSNWTSIVAGAKGDVLKWYIGDVTINSDTDDKRTIEKCEVRYCTSDQSWTIRSLKHAVTVYAPIKSGTNHFLAFGESTGLVMEDETGTNFNGAAISSEITTNDILLSEINKKTTLRELCINGDNLQFVTAQVRGNNPPVRWEDVTNRISNRDDIFKGSPMTKGQKVKIKLTWTKPGVQIEQVFISRATEETEVS